MKYTILGFSQAEACKRKLTGQELIFLRWFIDFMVTLKMKYILIDQQMFFWVDNKTVAEELPIIGFRHSTGWRRFLRGMVDKKLLDYHLHKGKEPYYRVNPQTISAMTRYFPIRPKRGKGIDPTKNGRVPYQKW